MQLAIYMVQHLIVDHFHSRTIPSVVPSSLRSNHILKFRLRYDIRLRLVPCLGPLLERICHANEFRLTEFWPQEAEAKSR